MRLCAVVLFALEITVWRVDSNYDGEGKKNKNWRDMDNQRFVPHRNRFSNETMSYDLK